MSYTQQRLLKWTPRFIAVIFMLFISMFALDIFSEDYTIWETIIGLLIHLIPTYFLIVATIIAWRWPALGGVLFVILGILSVMAFNTYRHPLTFSLISLPAFIIGVLFIWSNAYHRKS